MKTVVTPNEVAHLWANQIQQEAKNSNRSFYFYDKTIYSYGQHFPIATHYNNDILFTLDSYSVTTSGHINMARSAARHKHLIFCKDPLLAAEGSHTTNIEFWFNNIEREFKSLASARKPEIYLANINTNVNQLNEYLKLFPKAKLNKDQKATLLLIHANKDNIKEAAKQQELAKQQSIDKKRKALERDFTKFAKLWHEGNEMDMPTEQRNRAKEYASLGYINTMLRCVDGKEVQTSLGIKCPVAVAKRFYDKYIKVCKSGGCEGATCKEWEILGYKVAQANESLLVVGCHRIARKEIDILVKKMGW